MPSSWASTTFAPSNDRGACISGPAAETVVPGPGSVRTSWRPLPSVGPYVARGAVQFRHAQFVFRVPLLRGYRAVRLPITEDLPYAPEDVRMPRAAGDASRNACRRADDGQSCTRHRWIVLRLGVRTARAKPSTVGAASATVSQWRWISNASENARQSPIRSRPRRC
jgi:hypothetical protein